MSHENRLTTTLQELAEAFGLPDLELDDQSRVSFCRDGTVFTLSYCDSPLELLWIIVDLGPIAVGQEQALLSLLELNYLTWTSNIMTIGLSESGDRVFGHFAMTLSQIDATKLETQIQRMIETGHTVRQRLDTRQYELQLG